MNQVDIRLVSWNLFHGRDRPPEPALFTARSRLFRVTERGERYAQVNRPLKREFKDVLGRLEWDVALLQEAPPTWSGDWGVPTATALTDRNSFGALRAFAARLNPDLVASNEGGSNQLLVRPPWQIESTREHVISLEPERRVMLWTRLRAPDGGALAVANLHANLGRVPGSDEQVIDAAARAVEWARELPLVFGGDLNQHLPGAAPMFDELERRFTLAPPTPARSIDHLLLRGLAAVVAPHALEPETRELDAGDGLRLQLSDHPCVAATAGMR